MDGLPTFEVSLRYFNGKEWSGTVDGSVGFIPIEDIPRSAILDMLKDTLGYVFDELDSQLRDADGHLLPPD